MAYIACVRFQDKLNKNEFIPTTQIRYYESSDEHIEPENVEDFENQHLYSILWCLCEGEKCFDEKNEQCLYYDGYIVCFGETEEDAKNKSKNIRFRCPKKIFSSINKIQEVSKSDSQKTSIQLMKSANNQLDTNMVSKLKSTKAIKDAKRIASKEQLNKYKNTKFLNSRSSINFDKIPQELTSNECEKSIHYSLKQKSNQLMEERDDLNISDVSNLNDLDIDLNNEAPFNINEEEIRSSSPNITFSNSQEPIIKKPKRRLSQKEQVPIVPVDAEEQANNLYNTPEAQEVDPTGRERYQVDGQMIYLGEGKAVSKIFWDFLKTRGDTIFLREIAELICGKYKLVNRCIKPSKTTIILKNRSPRKVITPKKYFCIRELFQDYLNEMQPNKNERNKQIRNFNRTIGYKINDLRKQLKFEDDS